MTSTEFFTDAGRFTDVVEPLIARDPIGATMVSHLLANHRASPFPEPPLLAAVTGEGNVLAAALRVPGYPLVGVVDPGIEDPSAVLAGLVDTLLARPEPIIGFTGRRRTAQQLAKLWSARTGATAEPRMWTLMYRLGELIEPVGVAGGPRTAAMDDPADVALLADWFCEFRRETGVGRSPNVPDPDTLLRNVARGEVFTLWCVDGRPVATAGHAAVRHGASKIAPVYTPPAERRRGYGSAVTVAAVKSARRSGAGEITLFTDADYPASNAVYTGLGFEVIAEFAEFDVAHFDVTDPAR